MSRSIVQNPSHVSWSPKRQSDYIKYCYNLYVEKHGDPVPAFAPPRNLNFDNFDYEDGPHIEHTKKGETLSLLYRLGYDNHSLAISYSEFESAVLSGGSIEAYHRYRNNRDREHFRHYHRNDTYWYDSHGVNFREKLGYQKKPNQEKKNLSETDIAKNEWREKKGFNRKRNGHSHWYSSGRKTYAKEVSNRWNRRWEKRSIHNEDWDNFLTLKQIHDAWMWD